MAQRAKEEIVRTSTATAQGLNINHKIMNKIGFTLLLATLIGSFTESSAQKITIGANGMTSIQKNTSDGKNLTHAVAVYLGYAYSF